MNKNMNCHKCKFKGSVPGSAHSSCSVLRQADPENGPLLELMISGGQVSMTDNNGNPLVKLNPWGVKNGWAMWPIDFDPTWVDDCKFFADKSVKAEVPE